MQNFELIKPGGVYYYDDLSVGNDTLMLRENHSADSDEVGRIQTYSHIVVLDAMSDLAAADKPDGYKWFRVLADVAPENSSSAVLKLGWCAAGQTNPKNIWFQQKADTLEKFKAKLD